MTGCDDPRIDELLAAYALGSCSEEEAAAVAAHLPGCAACRATLAELELPRDALLGDLPPLAPPPHLKAAVMDRVAAEAELFDAASRRPRPARRRRLRLLAPLAGLAAAAVLAVALIAGPDDEGPATRTVIGQVDARRAPGATAKLVVTGDDGRLIVAGMPDPGRGRVYEVWLRRGTQAPRATRALFSVDRTGAGETAVPGIDTADQVLVTSEPAGGSTRPSRAPLLVADV